jgi:hypothetical protein
MGNGGPGPGSNPAEFYNERQAPDSSSPGRSGYDGFGKETDMKDPDENSNVAGSTGRDDFSSNMAGDIEPQALRRTTGYGRFGDENGPVARHSGGADGTEPNRQGEDRRATDYILNERETLPITEMDDPDNLQPHSTGA